jgi:hypothetical protein
MQQLFAALTLLVISTTIITPASTSACNSTWNGILLDSTIGYTQLVFPNQEPHVVSINETFELPNLMYASAVARPDGNVYFMGGMNIDGTFSQQVTRFNPYTNTTTNASSMNTERAFFGATVVGNTIIVCGGEIIFALVYTINISSKV